MYKFSIKTNDPHDVAYLATIADILLRGEESEAVNDEVFNAFSWLFDQTINYITDGASFVLDEPEGWRSFVRICSVAVQRIEKGIEEQLSHDSL